jgi:UDP-N-acetylmuramoyl-tripeptide--D-alanyl-D-alanine ligase
MTKLYTIGEMSQIFKAKTEKINTDLLVHGFSIDSRTMNAGELFFCIKGENTDGHHYIPQALEKGACAVVADPASIPETIRQSSFPRILVQDPNLALREWAADIRKRFTGKVLAVTGSNGKTTTKEILAGLCRHLDPNAYATPGNFNNFIGVPLTLLEAPPDAKWWVIEIGTNHFGEVAELSKVVQPTAGIITNIGQSHLEFLQNTEGVAKEKSGLFAGMSPGNKVIVPDTLLHLDLVEEEAVKAGVDIVKTTAVTEQASEKNCKIRISNEWFESSIDSPLLQQNLVLALTLLKEEGVPVALLKQAAAALDLSVKGRYQQIEMDDWILIDDTYNANPSSFYSVLENLNKTYPGLRKIVVCGAMAELGDLSPELHRQVGETMVKNGVEKMFGLGGAEIKFYLEGWKNGGGETEAAQRFSDIDDLTETFREELRASDVVLVKGSRSAKMERFVEAML